MLAYSGVLGKTEQEGEKNKQITNPTDILLFFSFLSYRVAMLGHESVLVDT